MSDESSEGMVELPHGAWFEAKTGQVFLTLGRMTIGFSLEEFDELHNMVEDVGSILDQIVLEAVQECPTCGTQQTAKVLVVPQEEDFN